MLLCSTPLGLGRRPRAGFCLLVCQANCSWRFFLSFHFMPCLDLALDQNYCAPLLHFLMSVLQWPFLSLFFDKKDTSSPIKIWLLSSNGRLFWEFLHCHFCLSSNIESCILISTATSSAVSTINNLQYFESWFNVVIIDALSVSERNLFGKTDTVRLVSC